MSKTYAVNTDHVKAIRKLVIRNQQDYDKVSQDVCKFLAKYNLKYSGIAKILGVSEAYVWKIVKGHTDLKYERVKAIRDTLNEVEKSLA